MSRCVFFLLVVFRDLERLLRRVELLFERVPPRVAGFFLAVVCRFDLVFVERDVLLFLRVEVVFFRVIAQMFLTRL